MRDSKPKKPKTDAKARSGNTKRKARLPKQTLSLLTVVGCLSNGAAIATPQSGAPVTTQDAVTAPPKDAAPASRFRFNFKGQTYDRADRNFNLANHWPTSCPAEVIENL